MLLMLTLCRAQAQTTGSISGTIMLSGLNAIAPPHLVSVEFVPARNSANGNAAAFTQTVPVSGETTRYQLDNIPAGTYNISVSVPLWLRVVQSNVTVPAGPVTQPTQLPAFELGGGDTDGNGMVDVLDFGKLVNAYGSDVSIPASGYDPTCDFNWDGAVDVLDFGILVNSYGAGAGQGSGGVLYPITLTADPSAGNEVTLHWDAPTDSGNGTVTYTIYRSPTPAHGRDALIPRQSSNKYTETLPDARTYYYQVVAAIPNTNGSNTTYSYGLSNEVAVASNPQIENFGNRVFRITGFQSDRTTVNYQALVTNGLLNSYQVNGHELFHTNPTTGVTLPIQFAPLSAQYNYVTLSSGNQPDHQLALTSAGGNTLSFANAANTTRVNYVASPNSLQMALDTNYTFSVCLPLGSEHDANQNEAVYAVQNNPVAGQGFARLPGNGVTYSLPVPCDSVAIHDNNNVRGYGIGGIRNLRCLFNDSAVDLTYALNDDAHPGGDGALFNYVSPSVCNPYTCWGHDFAATVFRDQAGHVLATGAYAQFTFASASASALQPNTAPPFHLVLEDNAAQHDDYGMYADISSNHIYCQAQIDANAALSGAPYTLTYTYTDFWGNPVTGTNTSRTLTANDFSLLYPGSPYQYANLALDLPHDSNNNILSGYFFLKASLTPSSATTGVLPNESGTELGVYHVVRNVGSLYYNPNSLLYDVPLPVIQQGSKTNAEIVEPFNAINAFSANPGVADPGGPRMFGMRAVRIDYGLEQFPYNQTTQYRNETDPYSTMPRPPFSGVSTWIDLLSLFSNSGTNYTSGAVVNNPIDSSNMVLIGSIGRDQNGVLHPDDVSHMVTGLTYVQAAPNTGAYAANPIKYWSIDNEPGNIDFTSYLKDYLKPSVKNVKNAYTGYTAVNTPVVMGPNLVRVELNSDQGPLSWWDTFFNTTYTGDDGNIHYALELLDAVSTHTYTGDDRSWEEHGVAENLALLQKRIAAAPNSSGLIPSGPKAGQTKDLWITEHGWNWNWSADMPRLQADYIVRRYALGAAAGIPHEHNAYYYTEANAAPFNFYLWDRVPNRGGMAMRIFNEFTGGKSFDSAAAATLDTGKYDATGYRLSDGYVHVVPYTDGVNETLVAWGDDFTDAPLLANPKYQTTPPTTAPVSITLMLNSAPSVYDAMGNPITVTQVPNSSPPAYIIPVTGSPTYITGPHGISQVIGLAYNLADGWPSLHGRTNYALNIGNLATGPQASASSFAPVLSGSNPATFADPYYGIAYFCSPAPPANSLSAPNLNDGAWQYDDRQSDGKPTPHPPVGTRTAPVKSAWISGVTYPILVGVPDTSTPILPPPTEFSLGESTTVMLTGPKTIDTLVAVVPSNNNSTGGTMCGARDYQFQILHSGQDPSVTTNWTPVKTGTGNTTEWVLYAQVPAAQQNVTGVRLVVGAINNGRWYDDYNSYIFYDLDYTHNTVTKRPIYGSPMRAMVYELEAYGPNNQ